MKPVKAFIVVVLMATIGFGCISNKTPVPVEEKPSIVLSKLEQSAQGIHNELRKLTQIEEAARPSAKEKSEVLPTPTIGSLAQKVTLRWAGPLEPAAKTLASMIGYQFSTVGRKPTQARIINIDALEVSAFDILQDMGWQAGENAGVIVDENTQTLKIAYMNSAPVGGHNYGDVGVQEIADTHGLGKK